MSFYIYSALLNAFISGLLGVVVVLKNRKDLINRLFFGLSTSVVFWSLGYWRWMSSTSHDSALLWIRLLSVGSLFIPIFYFHWILTFTDLNRKKVKLITALYFLTLFFAAFSFSPLFIKDVGPKLIFPFWPTPGVLYDLYLVIIYLGITIYSLVVLLNQYKLSQEPKKSDIKYIIFGSIVGFGGGATNFFLWYNIPILPYGNILVSLYPIMIAIAIFKYQLFNVKVVYAELVTFSVWIFSVVRFFLSNTIRERVINGGTLIFLIVAGILLIRSIQKEIEDREEKEKMATELLLANIHLKELDKAKSDFISIASHQLRSPVTAIKGYSSMILENSYGPITKKLKDPIEKIFESSRRLVLTIGDFLDVSKIESGNMQYDFVKFDIKEMLTSLTDEFKNELTSGSVSAKGGISKIKKDIRVELEVAEGLDYNITADQNKVRQVLSNLIDNAIKYTPKGFVNISLQKEINNKIVLIKIKDSGIGMTEATINKLFQKFTRAEGISKMHTDGSGLGLFVGREIIRAHGGSIWAESEGEGKGSVFCVRLPVDKIVATTKPAPVNVLSSLGYITQTESGAASPKPLE